MTSLKKFRLVFFIIREVLERGGVVNCQSDEKRVCEVEQEWYTMQGFKTDIRR